MKVAISVLGRFHAFDLAHHLEKRGALSQLMTSQPGFALKGLEIPSSKVRSHVINELMPRVWGRLPRRITAPWNPQAYFARIYDNWASRQLDLSANIFVGWSNASLATLRHASANGMKTVVERCSTHIVHQTRVLEEEYAHFGLEFNGTPPETIARELQEYEESDVIAVPSEFVRKTFLAQGVAAEKVVKNPYGVNLSQYYGEPENGKTFRVLFCGSLSIRKGVPRLLKTFFELDLPDAELHLVGPLTDEIMPFLKKYESSKILVHGAQPRLELRKFYSKASVFFLPSIEEGMAYVVPQAMACGLPIFCTRETGAEEAVENGKEGFFFSARDDDALVAAIEKAYRSREELREMGKAALKKIAGALTWEHYAHRAYSTYEALLAEPRFGKRASAV